VTPALWVLAATVVVLAVLGVIVALALRAGRSESLVDQAEDRADADQLQARRMAAALPTQEDRARAARRRLRERGARLPDDAA